MIILSAMEEEKQYLEDQFVLRLPREEAEYVRNVLATKPKKLKKRLQLSLDTEKREGTVWINKKVLPGRLRKLPTIVESLKTHNKVYCVKTADVTEILDCVNPEANQDMIGGLTPPLKNCKRKRFRKGLVNKDEAAVNIQKELFYLLQADLEAVSTRFEIIYEDAAQGPSNNATEDHEKHQIELFGNVLTDSEESDSNNDDGE